ncbi:MAG: histidine kinase, partial [Sediminibacterium sp.]|nr:histidine kinase [Sediminibacterium sp.]
RSTERMHGLLDNLIDFTNLINRSEKQSPVPLERPFKLAFEKVMGHNEVDLVMEQELPVVAGYEQQLVLLFTQLLSNAFQYRDAGRKLVIEVTASISDGTSVRGILTKTAARYQVVTIKDNGIGFDNVFHERIFVLFQRLHNQTEYTGKGIGLTIARRVMTNHYVYILASGIKGEGASFTLYFPIT